MTQLPRDFCAKNRILVVEESDGDITIGVSPSTGTISKTRTAQAIRRDLPGKEIRFRDMSEPDLMLAIAGIGAEQTGKKEAKKETGEIDADILAIANGAPIITVLNGILLAAHGRRASDIHLETNENETAVRFRIDGIMMSFRRLDAETGRSLSARIKLLANLNTLERRRPQDGRFRIDTGNGMCDMRVSTVPGIHGESVVLRFLDPEAAAGELESLGFQEDAYRIIAEIPGLPNGLVLVTGPTGCGKTTTLAALVRRCDPVKKKIITIEDPVEYLIPGVTQIQTNEAIGLGFSAILGRILRQDPDVIVVGEIRDPETAELAARAALTGHLVFSTLHTSSANEARTRLLDMGIPSYILDATLKAVIGQRLLGKVKKSDGTIACEGRIPVTEICYWIRDSGTGRTMRDEAIRLANLGITTMDEVERTFGKPTGSDV
jgi:general secretion pathway protein E/type IV pilus assembly protein PilB